MNRLASMLSSKLGSKNDPSTKTGSITPAGDAQTKTHFVDKLLSRIKTKGAPICVGIDPVLKRFPAQLRDTTTPVEAMEKFCAKIIKTVAPHTPAVKFQSACFERYFTHGQAALHRLMNLARSLNLTVILDAKRGDVGSTAVHYACGCLADRHQIHGPDALTINPYFGREGVEPFAEVAQMQGKGIFGLVRTGNPGADAFQSLQLNDGRTVAEALAQLVAEIGSKEEYIGKSGYSVVGAIVGAVNDGDQAQLRRIMPQQFFLVPGFDHESKDNDVDLADFFNQDGTGAIITASRSLIYAYEGVDTEDWADCVERAVARFKRDVNKELNRR